MKVKITPTVVKRREDVPPSMKELVRLLTDSDGEVLIFQLSQFSARKDRPRGDLCPWIPLLDKFDTLLEKFVAQYKLDDETPLPLAVDSDQQHLMIEILHFTVFLLEKCSNRSIYGSVLHLLCLLKSTSLSIVSAAITVLSKLPPRLAQLRTGVGKLTVSSPYETLIQKLATLLPISGQESINSSLTASITDFVEPNHHWSDDWSAVHLKYYTQSTADPKPATAQSPHGFSTPTKASSNIRQDTSTPLVTSSSRTDGLNEFYLFSDEVHQSSMVEMFAKACAVLPEDAWFTAINKIRVAKACRTTEDAVALRQELVKIQFHSLVFFCLVYGEDHTDNMVLSKSPNLLKQIGDLIPTDSDHHIPMEATILALETLLEISQQASRRSDVINVLSANVSHGTLMSVIRILIRDIKEGAAINEDYSTLLFMLLSSLSNYQQVGTLLASAGLLTLLLDLLQIESGVYVRTMAAAVELLDHIIIDVPSTFPIFLESQGVKVLIDTAQREIAHCVSLDLSTENRPDYSSIDYQLSYYRTQWIRSLFVVISNVLVQTRNTENLQNMVDSSLLVVSHSVITHPQLFGSRIVSLNLQILANMLEHESTAYGIMHEAHLIDVLVGQFDSMLSLSHSYYGPVAKVIAALAHSESGLKIVTQEKLIEKLFTKIVENLKTVRDALPAVAMVLDSLTADHAELRPAIVSQVINLLKVLPEKLEYTAANPELPAFNDGRSVEYIEGLPPTEVVHVSTNDAYYIVDQIVSFLEAFSKNHLTRAELINQHAICDIADICLIRSLPFDFAYSRAGYAIGKILRSMFTLDIDTKSFEELFISRIWDACETVHAVYGNSEPILNEEGTRHLAILNSYLEMFYEMVFFDCGTGYRVVCFMERIVKKEVLKDGRHDSWMGRLSTILKHVIWQDAIIVEKLGDSSLTTATAMFAQGSQSAEIKKVTQAIEDIEKREPGITKSETFRSYRSYRYLTSCTKVIISKIFLEFGNICCHERTIQPSRWTEAHFAKKKSGIRMAESIALGLNALISDSQDVNELTRVEYQYINNAISTIQHALLKSANYGHASILIGVFSQFTGQGGVLNLMKLFRLLWSSSYCKKLENSDSDDTKHNRVIVMYTLYSLLAFLTHMITFETILGSKKLVLALEGTHESVESKKVSWSGSQFFVETKIMIANDFLILWESDKLFEVDSKVSRALIGILEKIFATRGEASSYDEPHKSSVPKKLDWKRLMPSEIKIEKLVECGADYSSAAKALIAGNDDIDAAFKKLFPGFDPSSGSPPTNEYFLPEETGAAAISDKNEKLVLRSDLDAIRFSLNNSLSEKLLDICEMHPECVFLSAELIRSQYTVNSDVFRTEVQNKALFESQSHAIDVMLAAISKLANGHEPVVSDTEVSVAAHIVGMLFSDSSFFNNNFEKLLRKGSNTVLTLLKIPNSHERQWYSSLLLLVEKIVTNADVPEEEEPTFDPKLIDYTTAKHISEIRDKNFDQDVFEILSVPKLVTSDIEALSMVRLYVHYAKYPKLAEHLVKTGAIANIVRSLKQFVDSPVIKSLVTCTTILLRYAVETREMVRGIMYRELKHYFSSCARIESQMLLKTFEKFIARDWQLFVEVVGELCLCYSATVINTLGTRESLQKTKKKVLTIISSFNSGDEETDKATSEDSDIKDISAVENLSRKTPEAGESMEDAEMSDQPVSEGSSKEKVLESTSAEKPVVLIPLREKSSGVIDLLLDEIFAIPQVELFKEPVQKSDSSPTSAQGAKEQFEPKEHASFMYTGYLFQILSELTMSYNTCKMELINYKKKVPFVVSTTPVSKPQCFALARLLNDYVPHKGRMASKTATSNASAGIAYKKKSAIASLAKMVIVSLASASGELGQDLPVEEVYNEQTLVFVRKFLLDCVARSLKDVQQHLYLSLDRGYTSLISLSELCYELLSHTNKYYHSDEVDGATTAKIMFEKKFASLFSNIFSELDLNYPDASDVARSGLRFCLGLSRLAMDSDSVPNFEASEEDGLESDSYDDYREDTPNLFRNSTLGMFEVDDMYDEGIEDEDDDIEEEEQEHHHHHHHHHSADDNEMYYEEVDSDAYSDVEGSEGAEDHFGNEVEDDSESGSDTDDMGSVEFVVEEVIDEDEDMGSSGSGEDSSSYDSFDDDGVDNNEDGDYDEHNLADLASELLETLNSNPPPRRFGQISQPPVANDDEDDPFLNPMRARDLQFTDDEAIEEDDDDDDDESDIDDLSTEVSEESGVYFELDNTPGGRVRADRAFMNLLRDMGPNFNALHNPMLALRPRGSRNDREYTDFDLMGNGQRLHGDTRLYSIYDIEDTQQSQEAESVGEVVDYRDRFIHEFRRVFQTRQSDSLSTEAFNSISRIEYRNTCTRWYEFCVMFDVFPHAEVRNLVLNAIYNRIYEPSVVVLKEIEELEEKYRLLKEADTEKKEAEKKKKEEEEKQKKIKEEEEKKAKESEAASANDTVMESVEDEDASPSIEAAEVAEPVYVTIGGREIDVARLGVDPAFLEALPDDIREEAFTQHLRDLLATARANGQRPAAVLDPEFLRALPDYITEELDLDAIRGYNNSDSEGAEGGTGNGFDMELLNFLASLDRPLRQALLLEQDEETLARLPPEIAEQAYDLRNQVVTSFGIEGAAGRRQPGRGGDRRPLFQEYSISEEDEEPQSLLYEPPQATDAVNGSTEITEQAVAKAKTPKVRVTAGHLHLMDRAGIASLVRLLYLPQSARQREYLNELFLNLCFNKQNRSEILNFLLHVIQDGSADRHSVEKGFVMATNRAALSTPAKGIASVLNTPGTTGSAITKISATTPKTSTKIINSLPCLTLNESLSPVIVTQQVLEALEYLVRYSGNVKLYFLKEHELSKHKGGNKRGKEKELKEQKYPINMLFNLLDRPVAKDNSFTLELLSALIQEVTRPLPLLLKEEIDSKEKPKDDEDDEGSEKGKVKEKVSFSEDEKSENPMVVDSQDAVEDKEEESNDKDDERKSQKFYPPYIPEKSLNKICGILTAKECTSRTFQQILNVIHNLSSIPATGDLIGQELVAEATALGPVIVSDLKTLLDNTKSASRGSDVQGVVLAKFSSGSSDQAKLLRLLTAIDYLFVPEQKEGEEKKDEEVDEAARLLKGLYEQMTFGNLWGALSDCLRVIQERQDMIHVATALLPLIEALMVFCKHSRVKDVQLRDGKNELHPTFEYKEHDIANEPLESLFFSFSDEHRKILNQMIRNNPKLMSGSFSILFKNPKSLEFDNKRRFFYRKIYTTNTPITANLTVNVRRDQVFLDSYKALYFKSGEEIKYARLNIHFQGEEGVDAGGLTREWYQVLSRQMFNADYALFAPVASDRTSFHPNRTSWVNPEHLSFFKFIGRIIGKAIFDYKLLDCHFSRAIYRKILGKSVSIKDMESLDLDYYKSLMWMLENDITDIITETFSIEADDYGEQKIIDLKPDGRSISVTEENKQEYVRLVVEYRLIKSVQEQVDHFLEGFHDIVPKDVIAIFDEQELELLISGMPDIDFDDWRNNTEYENYSPSSAQVKWFWRAVRSFDAEEKAKLLQFATGTSKVPLNGFAKLEGINGIQKFNIHRDYAGNKRMPSSHTCFNQIDLPEYDSYDELRKALLLAITEGNEGFGWA